MDTLDRDLLEAERDASPDRFPSVFPYTSRHNTSSNTSSIHAQTPLQSWTKTRRQSTLYPVELGRIRTQALQHRSTVGSTSHLLPRPPEEQFDDIGAGKPFPPALSNGEDYVVEFMGPNDPLHPQNWPFQKKYARYYPQPDTRHCLTRLTGFGCPSCLPTSRS